MQAWTNEWMKETQFLSVRIRVFAGAYLNVEAPGQPSSLRQGYPPLFFFKTGSLRDLEPDK